MQKQEEITKLDTIMNTYARKNIAYLLDATAIALVHRGLVPATKNGYTNVAKYILSRKYDACDGLDMDDAWNYMLNVCMRCALTSSLDEFVRFITYIEPYAGSQMFDIFVCKCRTMFEDNEFRDFFVKAYKYGDDDNVKLKIASPSPPRIRRTTSIVNMLTRSPSILNR